MKREEVLVRKKEYQDGAFCWFREGHKNHHLSVHCQIKAETGPVLDSIDFNQMAFDDKN